MTNWIRRILGAPVEPVTKSAPKAKNKISAKDAATARGEPFVNIVSMNIDKKDIGQGSFELEWNELFVAQLLQSGYRGKTDEQIVDQWFTDLCRNIVMETLEQELADPEKRLLVNRKDLGDGRAEFS